METAPQMAKAIEVLGDLSRCIEMRMDFPFEHILLDCCVLSMLASEQRQDNRFIAPVETLLVTYLQMPVAEARERILRRIYQRLRMASTFVKESGK